MKTNAPTPSRPPPSRPAPAPPARGVTPANGARKAAADIPANAARKTAADMPANGAKKAAPDMPATIMFGDSRQTSPASTAGRRSGASLASLYQV